MGRKSVSKRADKNNTVATAKRSTSFIGHLAGFVLGGLICGLAVLMWLDEPTKAGMTDLRSVSETKSVSSGRSVSELMALADEELETVDLVEMHIAAAREIPGLGHLEYSKYKFMVDGWTQKFQAWLPSVEPKFHRDPGRWKNDIAFFRIGMLAQFLDEALGIHYVEEQKQTQIEARKKGTTAGFCYTDPGHLLLHGLIDTREGTCATMPALHVAMARRMGWPVGLALAGAHFVSRYDDGKNVYNLEMTATGKGGFSVGSDAEYIEDEGVSRKAIAVGCDMRKLTGREMLATAIQNRARHFADTKRSAQAARDYATAYVLFPQNRRVYMGLTELLVSQGEHLFAKSETGHPISLARFLAGHYLRSGPSPTQGRLGRAQPFDVEAFNRANRQGTQQLMNPHQPPQPTFHQPTPAIPHATHR
jgi:hypothetical protein